MSAVRDLHSASLFDEPLSAPGALGCAIEIAATMTEALERARHFKGLTREHVTERMAYHLGEKLSVATLNGYCAHSHEDREPSLRRAMAFDAALGDDVLLNLYARKRGGRQVVSDSDAALLEWARLHHQERELAERRRQLEAVIKTRGRT
ncbi:hypothetical protein [Thauera aromatica]|uniref:hypothetical protein n=1 Tax=Thauera aromatica TaxID=59405 RepID=UPI001FFC59C0|nr:hypothetical protein [Thauera aromatica]MCK2095668.1 hypothetical protein [Thauera aromatica]